MKSYEELTEEVMEKVKSERAKRRAAVRRIASASLALALVVGAVFAVKFSGRLSGTVVPGTEVSVDAPPAEAGPVSSARGYGEIFDLLSVTDTADADYSWGLRDNSLSGEIEKAAAEEEAVPEVPKSSPTVADSAYDAEEDTSEYSETNVQVEGIDEADVVKTDGKYIYAVSHSNVYIISAENGEMETAAKIPFRNEDGTAVGLGGAYLISWMTPEIYITDDRLVVVTCAYEAAKDEQGNEIGFYYRYNNHVYYAATVYDISDRAAPSLLDATYVSGDGVSSRLTDGKLYLIAEDRYYEQIDREDPTTFIPVTYKNGEEELIPADDIYCGEEKSDCCYLNIIEVDVTSASVTSQISLLGYDGDIIYQNADNIFAAKTDYSYDYSEETTDGVTRIVNKDATDTVLTKISVKGGLALVGSARLDGYLHNSFSMDEYEGYLRVVTSVRRDEYVSEWREVPRETEEQSTVTGTVYGDGDIGFFIDDGREYIKDDWTSDTYNNLYVLDSAMNVTGKLERLAPDERIYSCRFEGNDGYFVTYRETDPLFHVDLSDPTSPRVIDELKIPGHSDYLERFGDHLFGFGADDEGYLKLSMFSEDEDGTMSEIATISIPGASYSEALYDHHAILADAAKGIICFGAETWYADYEEIGEKNGTNYYIVKWNGQAFEIAMTARVGEWTDAIRGLFIGDTIYVYVHGGNTSESSITSFGLGSYEKIGTVEMDEPVEEQGYGWDEYAVDEAEPIAIYD